MRKRIAVVTLCLILSVSVIGNIYFARERSVLLKVGSLALGGAVAHLQIAVKMPIQSRPDNTLADRALEVATAAAYLTSAAHSLDREGVSHVEGIALAMNRFSYDLPYPNVFGKTKVGDEWRWVMMVADEFQADGSNLKELKTDIDNLFKSMPVTDDQRSGYYSAPLQ